MRSSASLKSITETMGWLSGSSSSNSNSNSTSNSNSNTNTDDPFRDLDPSLRDFLETNSPSQYSPPPPPPPPEPTPPTTPAPAPIPSLYSDGRYAHLWSTYRPLSVVEDEAKSDQEKALDVLQNYKVRKSEIARAALENCALEQGDVNECIKNGGWVKRMTMCREEHKVMNRCYLMQSRFLKALGYLSSPRPASVDEEIQMHADTLYHRMLAQEAAIAEAKASNAPIPTFPPIIPSSTSTSPSTTSTPSSPYTLTHQPPETFSEDQLTPAAREALQNRLKDLPPEERALEERATAMEASQSDAVGRTVKSLLGESERKRRERIEKGEAGLGDVISSWFGR